MTGYWFLDVFAYMNLVLVTGLLFASMKDEAPDEAKGSGEDDR